MVTTPPENVLTKPDGLTLAIEGSEELQTPPATGLDKEIVFPSHTLVAEAVVVPGTGLTVIVFVAEPQPLS